jgi:hypothetical protein
MGLAFIVTFILKWSMTRMLAICVVLGVGFALSN